MLRNFLIFSKKIFLKPQIKNTDWFQNSENYTYRIITRKTSFICCRTYPQRGFLSEKLSV